MKNLSLTTKVIFIFLWLGCNSIGFAEVTSPGKDLRTVGWVEKVNIFPGNLKIKAKLDTGAEHASLNATHIDEFERSRAKWVRFDVTNWNGRKESIEARIIRTAKIKQHGRKSAMCPVIRLRICLGKVY
jgi:hypothetical protein